MIRIMTVLGTRPEAIKMAPVIKALQAHPDQFSCYVCVTAQHRQMLDQVLDLFSIKPDIDLNIMRPNQTLPALTADLLTAVTKVLEKEKPDMVLVQGDTTTCFAAALAAFYQKIPVGHVEAGLRTYNKYAPFPEEANRLLTTHLAKLHFAPTNFSKQNLLKENISERDISVTGNTVIDALLWVRNKVKNKTDWGQSFGSATQVVMNNTPFILVTGHRRENFGEGFLQICAALALLAEQHPTWHIVYPVHLNPQVQEPVRRMLSAYSNIHLLEPLDYAPFVYLMEKCYLILSDSGGVQEEAPSLGKPVLVMREITERPEAVEVGTVAIVGTLKERIVDMVNKLIFDKAQYNKMTSVANPYGDGFAAIKMIEAIKQYFNVR